MRQIITTFLLTQMVITAVFSQVIPPAESDSAEKKPPLVDPKVMNLNTDPPSKFDLVFNRGFILTGTSQDTVPVNGSNSGTFSIGGGIKFPLANNTFGIRLTPGVAFTQINYNQTSVKTFPTIPDSLPFTLTSEKHRLMYVEVPLGVYFNVSRDEDNDPKLFVEAGGYFGYMMGASYSYRYNNSAGQRVKVQTRDLEKEENEFQRIRYGIYGRLGYKWAALYINYRLSNVLDEFANNPPKDVVGYKNPKFPPIEVGLTIFL